MVVRSFGRLVSTACYFFLCDVQERFRPNIKYYPEIITLSNKMVEVANIFNIPLIVTEHYSKAFGPTVSEINIKKAKGVFEKTSFSMIIPEVDDMLKEEQETRKSVVIFGVQTQICVQQTALDLMARGYDVHVVADAVSSCTMVERIFSLERMRQSGVFVSTTESVIIDLLANSKHPKFKEILPFIKNTDSALLFKL